MDVAWQGAMIEVWPSGFSSTIVHFLVRYWTKYKYHFIAVEPTYR